MNLAEVLQFRRSVRVYKIDSILRTFNYFLCGYMIKKNR